MDILLLVLILLGAAEMVANIVFYIIFMLRMSDVISGGVGKDKAMFITGLILLIFFLIGYVYVGIFVERNIVTSLILFFGSIFVSVVIILLNRLLKTSKERSLEVAQILISVIDSRGPNLQGHSLHVKNLISVFYKHLPRHLKGDCNLVSLEYAALLHDVGKLEMPAELLNKEGHLDEKEEELMKTHPQVAVRLLRPIKSFDYISDWILYHHERVDGNGYYLKKDESIPLPSKMIAIVDAYSAITMGRVYSAPKSHEETLEIIKSESGSKFDEELVEVFLNIPKEELVACTPKITKY